MDLNSSRVTRATSHTDLGISHKREQKPREGLRGSIKGDVSPVNSISSKGRVMLIDGTAIIYRAYYKLLGILIYLSVSLTIVTCFSWKDILLNILRCLGSSV